MKTPAARPAKTAPLRVTIIDVAFGGDGVAHAPDGRVLFVPFALPGEELLVDVRSSHKRFLRGEIREILKPSTERVAPVCPLFGRCGGCQYQHLAYPAQVALKTRQLQSALARLGGIATCPPVLPQTASPKPYGYRNKLRLETLRTSQNDGAETAVPYGFYGVDNDTLLPVTDCPLARPELNQLLAETVRSPAAKANARLRNPQPLTLRLPADGEPVAYFGTDREGKGEESAEAGGSKEFHTTLPEGASRDAILPQPVARFCRNRPGPSRQDGPTLPQRVPAPLSADAKTSELTERLCGRPVQVPLRSFWQINPEVAEELVTTVRAWFAEFATPVIVDAYAGVGVFSLALGSSGTKPIVIETDAAAVATARRNLEAWGVTGAEFLTGQTELLLLPLLERLETDNQKATVILDPPRTGCLPPVLHALTSQPAAQVLYVSCNAATLARDLRVLLADGRYTLARLALFDMFPQTAHFESVALLTRNPPV